MNTWKRVLWLGAGILFSAPSLAQETHELTLQWDTVLHADSYRLEEKLNGTSWDDAVIIDTSSTSETLTGRAAGDYVYRVIGCVTNPTTSEVLCDEVAEYSDEYAVTLANASPTRRVIFIHTDLLGSPAAETDEQGNVQ